MRRWHIWVLCGILLLAGGLWIWSRGYVNILPYAMILLCPLMHFFMLGGHHSKGHGSEQTRQDDDDGTVSKGQHKPACH